MSGMASTSCAGSPSTAGDASGTPRLRIDPAGVEPLRTLIASGSLASDRSDVHGTRTLGVLLRVERDPLSLPQRPEALSVDRALMDEEILIAFVRRDEAKAFLVTEELDDSF